MTALGDSTSKQLYIPDYDTWDTYYQRKAKQFSGSVGHTKKQGSGANKECSGDRVNLKFVSPVTETLNQVSSEIKASESDSGASTNFNSSHMKKKKKKNSKNKTFASKGKRKDSKKTNKKSVHKSSSKKAVAGKPSFSHRTLNDIFSKRK